MEAIGTGTYETDGLYFKTTSTGGGYRTLAKVDLTNYNTITCVGKCDKPNTEVSATFGVCTLDDTANFVLSKPYETSENSMVIDVSSLSGEYYVGLNNYRTVTYTKGIKIA